MTNTKPGFSFAQYPANRLTDAYLDLSERPVLPGAMVSFPKIDRIGRRSSFTVRRPSCLLRCSQADCILVVGRLRECLSYLVLECQNGRSTERGLYIYNEFTISVTRHHKAKRSANKEFNVVRFPPVRLAHAMYKYLVCIRRFLEMLKREDFTPPDLSVLQRHLLFRSEQALVNCRTLLALHIS